MHGKTEFRTTRPWTGLVDGLPVLENRRLEGHNNIVLADTGTPWDYEPRGPFQFQTCHESGDATRAGWIVKAEFWETINEFARHALPPRKGYAASVVDESFRRVLGGLWSGEAWEMGGVWFGCEAAFNEMRRQCVCDDVSIAMWEVTAMRTSPGSGMIE